MKRDRCATKSGSSTNEVRGDICALNLLALIDDVSAATEPERLAHISLGQENPRVIDFSRSLLKSGTPAWQRLIGVIVPSEPQILHVGENRKTLDCAKK